MISRAEALAIKKYWFDQLDQLPPEWRALSHEYPGVDDLVEMYYSRIPLPVVRAHLHKEMTLHCASKWPSDYPLTPLYDPRVKEPYK
jgi:hypothetical protein